MQTWANSGYQPDQKKGEKTKINTAGDKSELLYSPSAKAEAHITRIAHLGIKLSIRVKEPFRTKLVGI
jgi:hypothetical protein